MKNFIPACKIKQSNTELNQTCAQFRLVCLCLINVTFRDKVCNSFYIILTWVFSRLATYPALWLSGIVLLTATVYSDPNKLSCSQSAM